MNNWLQEVQDTLHWYCTILTLVFPCTQRKPTLRIHPLVSNQSYFDLKGLEIFGMHLLLVANYSAKPSINLRNRYRGFILLLIHKEVFAYTFIKICLSLITLNSMFSCRAGKGEGKARYSLLFFCPFQICFFSNRRDALGYSLF